MKEKYENNKPQIQAYMKTYYKNNIDNYKQYYIKNAVKINEYSKEYKKRKEAENNAKNSI